jgi:hypothetical protein
VTKAAASQPGVVPQRPKKQTAPIAPRTTEPVLAPAQSTLLPSPRVQEQPAQPTPSPPLPTVNCPLVGGGEIEARLETAEINMWAEECIHHPNPYFCRDPFFNSAQVVVKGKPRVLQCRKARKRDFEDHKEHLRKPFFVSDLMKQRFFSSCCSSRKTENRSSAAPPKAKTVRFASIDKTTYRCIPACSADPEYFEEYGQSTVSWEPSKEEVEDFNLSVTSNIATIDVREARLLRKARKAELRARPRWGC